jgi:formate dehydrogenase subunit gamma
MAEPRVQRFNRTQRALHWSHSITFFILLATGIVLLVKQVGEVVGHHLLILQFHEYTALFYIFGPLLWVILGNRRSLARDVKEFDEWDQDDVEWLKKSVLKGPSARNLPPQGRFNAGQKLNGILTISATLGFVVTGIIVWRPPWIVKIAPSWIFGDAISNNAVFLHQLLTFVSIPLVLGHIYLAAVSRATRPSLSALTDGTVPLSYAREHHAKWAAEIEDQAIANQHADSQNTTSLSTH